MLLHRDVFRESVFERDNNNCVICNLPAVDAHHIIERRLFPDGGYYLDNGASLCGDCHLKAEQTVLTTEQIKEAANITNIILPPHFYKDVRYDKWGNTYLQNKNRTPGELFYDESVQKVLKSGNVLSEFQFYIKYPRTYHLPWSESITDDNRIVPNLELFENKEVVVTEKMDGENTSIYHDGYFHARSIDSDSHPSQGWARNFASKIAYELPEGWRICGENLYATHSIKYSNLNSYFYGFSIWNEKNMCLNWDDTVEYFSILDIEIVPVLYKGIFDETLIKSLYQTKKQNGDEMEGYVVRLADEFSFFDFKKSVAKFVRKNHVQPDTFHWKFNRQITTNDCIQNKK